MSRRARRRAKKQPHHIMSRSIPELKLSEDASLFERIQEALSA